MVYLVYEVWCIWYMKYACLVYEVWCVWYMKYACLVYEVWFPR